MRQLLQHVELPQDFAGHFEESCSFLTCSLILRYWVLVPHSLIPALSAQKTQSVIVTPFERTGVVS